MRKCFGRVPPYGLMVNANVSRGFQSHQRYILHNAADSSIFVKKMCQREATKAAQQWDDGHGPKRTHISHSAPAGTWWTPPHSYICTLNRHMMDRWKVECTLKMMKSTESTSWFQKSHQRNKWPFKRALLSDLMTKDSLFNVHSNSNHTNGFTHLSKQAHLLEAPAVVRTHLWNVGAEGS